MRVISALAILISVLTALVNLYIYTYPSLNAENCSWKHQKHQKHSYLEDVFEQYAHTKKGYSKASNGANSTSEVADIRLLAIGDPQINGNWPSTKYIKRLDNYGNDYYLGHIYQVMKRRLQPSHVAVMGDLFSSQWISDSEYYNRTRRFITRLFPGPEEYTAYNLDFVNKHEDVDWVSHMHWFQKTLEEGGFKGPDQYDFQNIYDWTEHQLADEPLFINLTGNHDIGYGDTTYQHMTRFRRLFGKDNYWIEYGAGTDHAWRIVVLNSLALDGPSAQPEFLDYTWQFVETLRERPFEGSTILLTHIPFYKREGLCRDGPFSELYTPENAVGAYAIGKLKSENHLQYETSQRVLSAVFTSGKPGIVMTGHDHEGCENYYNLSPEGEWYASKEVEADVHIKEITVRAIMGEFGGNTGIMTGHFDEDAKQWEFDYTLCPFIVQHVWWAAQIGLLLSVLLVSGALLF
ncbi:unnamed protein product [Kuraishia capsulata CBS 1993]|uniref:Calcineurin-like phosphoesterase domain-containing protein n=1 Tax=Kuraishia capsulata CBS 1993 TaxID=1382522 RepID=W6MPW0_9ASCO|nr:uncharacterized protein KUCA_T00003205001 [Kuraishia capsulata CBS 1993]CDK27227.1 unnamed protein product [Kuraishia capsulata CBS 1993]